MQFRFPAHILTLPSLMLAALGSLAMLSSAPRAWAQPANEPAAPAALVVAARVDGEPIYVGQVESELANALKARQLHPQAVERLKAETLEQIITRKLALNYLATTSSAATQTEVDAAMQRVADELERRQTTLADFLAAGGVAPATLRDQLAWEIAWPRYLERFLTEENLARFFERKRRDFDGTRLHVAHILWKQSPEATPAERQQALQQAASVREEILAGKTTFAAAAARHSQSPTADAGGDIGKVSRHIPMPDSFNQAAFALQAGDVSPPVATRFGVHLITVLEVEPGERRLEDVREEVAKAAGQFLFRWSADRQRPTAKIEYTDAVPHYRPGSAELIPATGN